MRRRIAVCFVIALVATFGASACAGGEGQQGEVELLEERVEALEERVEEMQVLLGIELAEDPQQEQTQQEQTQ